MKRGVRMNSVWEGAFPTEKAYYAWYRSCLKNVSVSNPIRHELKKGKTYLSEGTKMCDCEVCGDPVMQKRIFATRRRGLPVLSAETDMNHFMSELMCGKEGYILTCAWCRAVWGIHLRDKICLTDADLKQKAYNWSSKLSVQEQKRWVAPYVTEVCGDKSLSDRRELYIQTIAYQGYGRIV